METLAFTTCGVRKAYQAGWKTRKTMKYGVLDCNEVYHPYPYDYGDVVGQIPDRYLEPDTALIADSRLSSKSPT